MQPDGAPPILLPFQGPRWEMQEQGTDRRVLGEEGLSSRDNCILKCSLEAVMEAAAAEMDQPHQGACAVGARPNIQLPQQK